VAENSNIEWTSHTFNAWRGCTKVSDGCKNCYAETLSGRNPKVLGDWGPKGKRVIAAESYWKEPMKWNREAMEAGERRRVFCASLADVFEGRDTMPEESFLPVRNARFRMFNLIEQTPALDWLLLTKRPQNIIPLLPDHWQNELPGNVWVGTSVENQQAADERIPHLLRVPSKVRFLSCEPLLGPVDVKQYLRPSVYDEQTIIGEDGREYLDFKCRDKVNWVIVGGESGPNARPMHPDWARSLHDQCEAAGVAFFFKQWGGWVPERNWCSELGIPPNKAEIIYIHPDGTIKTDVRNGVKPGVPFASFMVKADKKAAGRNLDGRTWDEFPEVR
jgi:protein gp37